MSNLKSAWELSLERSDDLAPEFKSKKKLTKKQKEQIAEVRKDYTAQIADRDVTVQDKIRKLSNRVPPEEIANAKLELETQFRQEKKSLEEEMEQEIESIRYCIGRADAWTAANDLQALLLLRNPRAGQTCARDGEELVEGIQNLQVRYGIDTNNDGFANRYITAPDPWTTADLANVRTLRVELVVRSLANGITRAPVPYTLEGNVITPAAGDLHLYKVMTSTITLRNKGT